MTTAAPARDRLASHADIMGITVTELLTRLARYAAAGFPAGYDAAASETAGLTAAECSQLAYEAAIARPANPERAVLLCEIAADRRAARLADEAAGR